jgi:hypothetical protein
MTKFANVAKIDETKFKNSNKKFAKYAVIALWKFKSGMYYCYRTFVVNYPCLQKITYSSGSEKDSKQKQEAKVFLHKTQKGNLVFFTKNKVNY